MSEDRLLSPVHHPRIPAQRGPLIDLSVSAPPAASPPVTHRRLTALAVAVFLAGAGGYTALRPALPSFAPSSVRVAPAPTNAAEPDLVHPGVPSGASEPAFVHPGLPSGASEPAFVRSGVPSGAADPVRSRDK